MGLTMTITQARNGAIKQANRQCCNSYVKWMDIIMNKEFNDRMAKALGITKEEQGVLESNHPYSCRCETCKSWWKMMGPDGDEPGNYGPFSAEEIEQS
jgi:hypothetical protein